MAAVTNIVANSMIKSSELEVGSDSMTFSSSVGEMAAYISAYIIALFAMYGIRQAFSIAKIIFVYLVQKIYRIETTDVEVMTAIKNRTVYLYSKDSIRERAVVKELNPIAQAKRYRIIDKHTLICIVYVIEMVSICSSSLTALHMAGIKVSLNSIALLVVVSLLFSTGGLFLNMLSGISMMWTGPIREGACLKIDDEFVKVVGMTVSHTYMERSLTKDEIRVLARSVHSMRDNKHGYHRSVGHAPTREKRDRTIEPQQKASCGIIETKVVPNWQLFYKKVSIITSGWSSFLDETRYIEEV